MRLINFLNNLFKKGGFVLIDANSKKYIIGSPNKSKPLTVKLLNKNLHYKLLINPDLYFGEAYMDGSLVIENGSISEFLELAFQNIGRTEINSFGYIIKKIKGTIRNLTNFNFAKKSKENVAHHYDISDDLYKLFLDPMRQYSCGYFKNEDDTLETAQQNKIDHIIKKLNIKSNQKVLDIGSGWGHLAIEIAKQSKCEVTGITLSKNQFIYANAKAKEYNLEIIEETKLKKVISDLYYPKKDDLKKFVKNCMKETYKGEYPGDLVINNIFYDIYQDDELNINRMYNEIKLFQENNM